MDVDEIIAGPNGVIDTGRYWNAPQECSHNYTVEYPTSSTTSGFCRGCGLAVRARLLGEG